MKKVLVTGGAGFIGSNLIKELKKYDNHIFSLDNYSTGSKENELDGVTYINDDITNNGNLGNHIAYFHLAGQPGSTII